MPKKIQTAVYPGTFDPITNGHLDIIERSLKLVEHLIVVVLNNPAKSNFRFTVDERIRMIEASTTNPDKIDVVQHHGLLVDFARTHQAQAIIRGLRMMSDFEYEFQMALTNRNLAPELETIFLMTDARYSYLNSSLVKQVSSLGGDVSTLVPAPVQRALDNQNK